MVARSFDEEDKMAWKFREELTSVLAKMMLRLDFVVLKRRRL
jgi:hypothetical protein